MKVGIIGCGIAGMATALALARDGHAVTVFERFAEAKPVGAGLLLQPSGLHALAQLGLREPIEAAGSRIQRLEGKNTRGRLVLDLRYDRWSAESYGLGVRRSVVFDALLDAVRHAGVAIILDTQILRVENRAKPHVHDALGRLHGPFDLVVVADGSNSVLRPSVSPGAKAPLYAWGAAWTTVTADGDAWDGVLRQVYHGADHLIGVLPIGAVPGEASGRIGAALFWSVKVAEQDRMRASGIDAFRQDVAALWPAAGQLMKTVRSMETVQFASYRHVSAWPWGRESAILIGDAAHAASPVLGHGANLALNDGVALARAFRDERGVFLRSLAAYRRDRRRFTSWAQLVAWLLTPLFQSHGAGLGWWRDRFLPIARAIPPLERLMLGTLVGRARLPIPSVTRWMAGLRLPPGA